MQFQKRYQSITLPYSNVRKVEFKQDKDDSFGVLLTNLLKAFDCLSHELLIAKLAAYGFSQLIFNVHLPIRSETKNKSKYIS